MARQRLEVVENNFIGALITEATELAFPPNSCTQTENMEHENTGRVSRRLGFDYESPNTLHTTYGEERVITGTVWNNVEGDGSLSIRVQQVGDILHFWIVYANQSISENKLASTVDLNTFKASDDVSPGLNECSYADANGRLVVCHPQCNPFYVTYTLATNTLTATQISVTIRDRVGLDDSLGIIERPTSSKAGLSDEHEYNLLNQGWGEDAQAHLDAWDTARTDMPSNADVWWFYRNTSNAFDTSTIGNESIGNTPAPKGHFVLDVHNEDRSDASGVSNIPAVSTGNQRLSKVAFFHNRVFYGGLAYRGKTSNIYASRIIEEDSDLGECYQEQDPTSEAFNVLTDADGAVIPVLGLENCVNLWALNNAVLIFGTNGIWALSGSEGIGFRPTDYTIRKISSIGALSEHSFIDVNGSPIWWNSDGIYQLSISEGGGFEIQSLTDDTIKTEYQSIPASSRKYAKGTYDPLNKKAYWVYANVFDGTVEGTYNYDRVLVLNALTGGFYIWKPAVGNVTIHDVFVVKSEGGTSALESVTDLENFELQSFTGDVVQVSTTSSGIQEPQVRYYVSAVNVSDSTQANYTFAYPQRTNYTDWIRHDNVGQDYTSIVRTGYRIDGGLTTYFQSNYVWVYLEQETDASCNIRGLWEWTNSEDSNRWSAAQELYNSARLFRDVNYRKIKVRGKGKALQLQFESVPGKPFTILGWSIYVTKNEGP